MDETLRVLESFVEDYCIPGEVVYDNQVNEIAIRTGSRWSTEPEIMNQLKIRAKNLGLWNLFMPSGYPGSKGVSMVEYSSLSEVMGRSFLAPEACNCSAPDTGNMEVLAQFGTPSQQEKWLLPLLHAEIRSAFLMTEPDVASSDATNISCSIRKENGEFIINGKKWWSTGALSPNCKIFIVMGRMDGPEWEEKSIYQRHTMVLVPAQTNGVKIERALEVFGYDGAPNGHAEILLENVRVPVSSSLLLGEGRGFEIAQSRLGPGRVHHCMRAIGLAERALTAMIRRSKERIVFGKALCDHDMVRHSIAVCRMEINQARLLVLDCAEKLECHGIKKCVQDVAMIKIIVPKMACDVIDRAIQVHGAMGVCQDTFLASAYAHMRTLRIADGPDEVHIRTVARLELKGPLETRAGRHSHLIQKTQSKL